MTDTSAEVNFVYMEMWKKIPGVDRLRMGCDMFSTAKELAIAGILKKMNKKNPKELRRQLFLRFYGTDFTPEECERILLHIESKKSS